MRMHLKLAPLPLLLVLVGCPEDKPKQTTVKPLSSATSTTKTAATTAASAVATTSATAAVKASVAANKAPTLAEWHKTDVVAATGAEKLGCEARIVRDWFRVSCDGKNDTGGTPVTVTVDKGRDGTTYTWDKGNIISMVTKIKEGRQLEATFSWTDKKHAFKLSWPKGAPQPEKLGAFGEAQKVEKKDEEGAKAGAAVTWTKIEAGKALPQDAFVAGQAGAAKLYVCRGAHEGSTIPGKVEAGSCHVAAGGKAVKLASYEVLTGKPEAFLWVAATDGALPPLAVKGGKDAKGDLHVCRAEHLKGQHPGALASNVCQFVHNDQEVKGMRFEVLVTAP